MDNFQKTAIILAMLMCGFFAGWWTYVYHDTVTLCLEMRGSYCSGYRTSPAK
jgi:hypothetical protein